MAEVKLKNPKSYRFLLHQKQALCLLKIMLFCVFFLLFGFSIVYCYLLSQIISTTDHITNESVLIRNTNKTYVGLFILLYSLARF